MLFSSASEYGIRTMLYLASQSQIRPTLIREIAQNLQIPFSFLAKIVQTLTRRGLLTSQKGPGGGVALARPAEEITLLQVLEAINGLDLTWRCVLGMPRCAESGLHCPLHEQWKIIRDGIVSMLNNQSIAQWAEQWKVPHPSAPSTSTAGPEGFLASLIEGKENNPGGPGST